MESTFLGYAMFYLVRNNLSPVAPVMKEVLHYNESQLGNIMAITAISYGLSKFVMGSVSDRCNVRKFMACGLLLTACCNFMFGSVSNHTMHIGSVSVSNYTMHLMLWSLNGFAQGMGWPPCGRSMGHWFSENERGLKFSIWNTSHNVGGGIAGYLASWVVVEYGGWQYAFYVPGAVAAGGAVYLFFRLRDTPQSVGLPPIEEYRNDYPKGAGNQDSLERTLTTRELFVDKVLTNKFVWLLAIANFFAYITRYSMIDWAPIYLQEVKGAKEMQGGLAIMVIEFGGIPSTIFLGWISDRIGGRRGLVAALCMIPVFVSFAVIMFTPKGHLWLDMIMLSLIGLFVYPVINLIVISALDVVSKKAIGTAAGFIGLFGYIGRTVQNVGFGWTAHHYSELYGPKTAWNIIFCAILASAVISGLLLALTWNTRPKA